MCEYGRTRPSFGMPGGEGRKDAVWCARCPSRPGGAVDVVSKRRMCECGLAVPSFGLPGGQGLKDALWCARCPSKPGGAVDVVSRRCQCRQSHPSFGLPEDRKLLWCSQCPTKHARAVRGAKRGAASLRVAGSCNRAAAAKEAAQYVGRRVMRPFYAGADPSAPPRWYLGEVTAVVTEVAGHEVLWRVVYEDKDEEDLTRDELEGSLQEPVYTKEEDGPLEVKRVKREA